MGSLRVAAPDCRLNGCTTPFAAAARLLLEFIAIQFFPARARAF